MATLYDGEAGGHYDYPSLSQRTRMPSPSEVSCPIHSTESPLAGGWSLRTIERIRGFLSVAHRAPRARPIEINLSNDGYSFIEAVMNSGSHKHKYDVAKGSLFIKARISQIHDGCSQILNTLEKSIDQATSNGDGGFVCEVRKGLTGTLEIYDRNNQLYIKGKEADGCLKMSIEGVERPRLPYLVLEVGYSESYRELVKDAKEWLMDFDKEVLAVILIKVHSKASAPMSYDVADWVGFVEVWERNIAGEGIQRFGERVEFLPPSQTPPTLPMRLNHTIPRHHLPDDLKDMLLNVPLKSLVNECIEAIAAMRRAKLTRAERMPAESQQAD